MRVFRKIEAKDNAAMAELIRSTLKKCKLDIPGTAYFDEGLDRLSEVYDCPGAGYYVLEDAEGSVVGGIGYAKLDFRKVPPNFRNFIWTRGREDRDADMK